MLALCAWVKFCSAVGAPGLNEIHKAQLLQQWAVFVELSTTEQMLNVTLYKNTKKQQNSPTMLIQSSFLQHRN